MTTSDTPTSKPLPVVRRRRWVSWLLAFLIFFSGIVVGGGLTVIVAVNRIKHAIQHPEEAPQRIASRLHRKLGLDEPQTESIRQIIARHQANLQAIRRDVQPRVETELEQTFSEIEAQLRPEQVTAWRKTLHELRENWMPPPPPPASAATTQPPTDLKTGP